jgi:hypothetical protein
MAAIAGSLDRPGLTGSSRTVGVVAASPASTRTGIRVPWPVYVSALILCQVAILWSAQTNSFTLYGDSRAHLDIARRLTDGLTPGFAQLGSVWLPLPHLLMAPFAMVDALWHSAAAGAIVGGISFVYSAVRVFSLAQEWLHSRTAAWCAFLVYALNLDLLYVQTTALTEPVLLAFFVGAAYHLTRWTRTAAYRDLLLAAIMVAGATLTRYEGWALFVVALVIVSVWTQRFHPGAHRLQANLVLYTAVAGYGIVLWFLYNLIIFHDPLQFLHSSFSSGAQQTSLAASGLLPTSGSLPVSGLTYMWDVIDVVGMAMVVVGLIGVVVAVFSRRNRPRSLAMLSFLAAPVAFNIVSLWLGQSTLRVPQVAPFGLWNDRYGLMALPLLAMGAALLVQRWRILAPGVLAVIVATTALAARSTPITVADGRYGLSSAAAGQPELAAVTLAHAYQGGGILADDASAAGVILASGLNLSAFVTVGFHPYFEDAMAAPAQHVEWVVAYDGDAIAQAIAQHPERFDAFHLVLRDGRIRLYTLSVARLKGTNPS